jgi:uncharacterized protein
MVIAREGDVRIPMSDGIALAADLYRPGGAGTYPAVLEHTPYRKDDVNGPERVALYEALAARGLAVVRVDVRGTGSSEGIALDEYTEREQLDGVEIVSWAAAQSWCSGRVGSWGISYGGFTSLQLAANRPPALGAIAVVYGTDDRYTDDMHFFGGALCALELGHYPIRMIAMNALPPGAPMDAAGRAAWRDRIERTPPWILLWLMKQRDGSYWRSGSLRPDHGRVQCPTLLVGGWRDGYCNAAVRLATSLGVPTEVVMGPWPHVLPDRTEVLPRVDLVHLLSSWFLRKLTDHGAAGPEFPVRVFMQSFDDPTSSPRRISGGWRGYRSWPDAEGVTVFDLSQDGRLSEAPVPGEVTCPVAPSAGVQIGNWCPPPPPDGLPGDQRADERLAVTFESKPFEEALECLGFPGLTVEAAHPGPIATIVAKLSDVAPDGASQLVTRAVLNLSRRDGAEPVAMPPDEWIAVQLKLNATAWRFEPGHRARLAIGSSDWPTVWPASTREPLRLRVGPRARLSLPIAPAGLGNDELGVEPPIPRAGSSTPDHATWLVIHDRTAQRSGIETSWGEERVSAESIRLHEALRVKATVGDDDPDSAVVEGGARFTLTRPDVHIVTEAAGRFSSIPSAFRCELKLDVWVDREPFASRTWDSEVARDLV